MLKLSIKSLIKRIFNFSSFRFILTGFLNTTATYALYLILNYFDIYYLLSYFFAFLTALIITTFLNIKFTFLNKFSFKKILIYGFYYTCYWFLSSFLIACQVEFFSINKTYAPLLTLVILIFPHFIISKKIITERNDKSKNL